MDTRNNSWLFPSVLLFVFVLGSKPHNSIAADTLFLGESLSGNHTIISSDGNFELGFFKPGESNNYYVGIWYKKVSVQTVVWVANRNKPLQSFSEFKLLANGNLVIYQYESIQSETSIWSTNLASGTSNTTEAVLRDDGNLVLRDGSNPSVIYWQSFDYPTDTWLPGGKLGLNKKTRETQIFTSWRNKEDPAAGIFSLELDPDGRGQYLIRWNKSIQGWTSGEWNEPTKTFTFIPEMRSNYIYNFSIS
ncbi:hypothetical protein MKX03_016253 [Papaver bracteatum]|nr:hypothetical protein MKX03_016253 [Papaver bracteatum]